MDIESCSSHFHDNELGGSAHGETREGLSEFGEEVIRKMEELGIVVDLAHASPEMIDDILAITIKPVIVSHTGVKGTFNNNRNLSDEQIVNIARHGGVIGIGYWDTATGGQDVESIVNAIHYVADLVGVEHVGLGSDFDGTTNVPFDTAGVILLTEALIEKGFSEEEIGKIMGGNFIAS